MTALVENPLPEPRYDFGGDEFVFVELSAEASFHANFTARAILDELRRRELPGVYERCPNSASYLVGIDPDQLSPDDLVEELKQISREVPEPEEYRFRARLVDVPMLYDDPWSTECLMSYSDRRQEPDLTDLEYMAKTNGFDSVPGLVEAHSAAPYLVMGVGFTPACYWSLQMVPRERTIVAPTYIRPRTTTPERAFSQGGAFAAIYPSPGPGGYQLIGMAPAPIFDVRQEHPDFASSPVFTRTGDVFKHRSIDRDEFDQLRERVERREFRYRMCEVDFEPARLFEDPDAYNEELMAELYGA